MKNKKWLWILVAAIALVTVVGLMLGIYVATRPETSAGDKHITVTVVHKDGTEKEFSYNTNEEYLGTVLQGAELIEGEQGPYGLQIFSVDGETADWNVDQSYWALYVGEEYGTTGVDQTPIHDGDTFKLVYTIG